MTPSRTSIVIATYNGERYIDELLMSITKQTIPPLEVIIADDQSCDNTLAICQDFSSRASFPVHIFLNKENLGYGENFLQATFKTKGEFIAFCDQDDILRVDKIERCESEFDTNPVVVLTAHTARLINSTGTPIGYFRQGIHKTNTRSPLSYSPWGVFFGFSMTFRRVLLEIAPPDLRGIDYITGKSRLAHDRWILLIANLVGSTREIAEPLVDYRQHDSNLFGARRTMNSSASRSNTRLESDRYLLAAEQQRAIVEIVARHPAAKNYGYDQSSAAEFLDRALDQQRARRKLYLAHGASAWSHWLHNIFNGTYRTPQTRRLRPQAVLRDLRFLLLRNNT